VQLPLPWIPVDVEVRRPRRARPMLEEVVPPVVGPAGDPHVIGHDVENLSHAMPGQRRRELRQLLFGADLPVQRSVIDDVVAMQAPGARLQPGRGVQVPDAQPGQVRDQGGGVGEGEVGVELDPVRGPGCGRAGPCAMHCASERVSRRGRRARFPERTIPYPGRGCRRFRSPAAEERDDHTPQPVLRHGVPWPYRTLYSSRSVRPPQGTAVSLPAPAGYRVIPNPQNTLCGPF
jgi:hypothetical protein